MSVHSCNEFCDKDIRLHQFQKSKYDLELGMSSKEEIKEAINQEIKELYELKDLLD